MAKRRTFVQRWRSLKGHARRFILAGGAALLAVLGAVASEETKGGIVAVIQDGEAWISQRSCRWNEPSKRDPDRPMILLAGFANDPHDEARVNLKSYLVSMADEFNAVLSCADFGNGKSDSIRVERQKFVDSLKPEIEAVNADLVLYGVAYPNKTVDLWSGNLLGGCDWQADPTNINLSAATRKEVGEATRKVLLRVITTGLVAACERQQDSDWRVVGRIFDIVSRYIEAHKLDLGDQYMEAVEPLFALAYTHYSGTADAVWFTRAVHSLEMLRADGLPENFYEEQLAVLYYKKFIMSNDANALQKSFSHISAAQQGGIKWDDCLTSDGDTVVELLKAAALDGREGVSPELVSHVEATNLDVKIASNSEEIRNNGKNADAYARRGHVYEEKKDYVSALADLDEAVRLNPNDARYLNSRCWDRAISNGDLQLALSDCNESLRLKPNDANALNSRGLVEYKLGHFDQAITDYDRAYRQDQSDAESLYGRGMAKLKKGDAAGAKDIDKARTMKPDIATTYAGYGMI